MLPALKQRGFTLVEIMVAIALSGILAIALVQIISNNRQNVVLSESYSQVQESGRLAMELLARDFRLIGFQGCLNSIDNSLVNSLLDTTSSGYVAAIHDFSNKVVAIDNFSDADTYGGVTPVAGSDLITSHSASSSDLTIIAQPATTSADILVSGSAASFAILNTKPIAVVSDCEVADIFAVTGFDSATGEISFSTNESDNGYSVANQSGTDGDLTKQYSSGDRVWVMNTSTFFIGPSAVLPGVNSLFKSSMLLGNSAVEMVPYINNMQLTYGIDTDSDRSVDVYKTAAQVTTDGDDLATDLGSIKIQLTIDSTSQDAGAPLISRNYTRVIQLRNSKLGVD